MAQNARQIEEANTKRRSQLLGLRYLDTRSLKSKPLYPDILNPQQQQHLRVVPIVSDADGITFAVTTNTAPSIMNDLRQRFSDHRLHYVLISDAAFKDYYLLYNPPAKVEYHDIELKAAEDAVGLKAISEALAQVKSEDMLAYIVKQAFQLSASDIHCENEEGHIRIRFRVDGVLHPIAELAPDKYRSLVAAVASAADLSTSAPDAQTGHIGRHYQLEDGSEVMINLRIETVPAIHGMDIVMRLFNFRSDMLHLDKIGLDDYQRQVINDIITNPTGLVMVVGPTGSGKSTTLYAMINELISPHRKLITLEDPVEYQVPGVTQIPIDSQKGASFAKGLREVLRLDPDVIMVGEIRDDDTARTALQAALTGHLVLTTYHASSTSAALSRILDATSDNPLFLNALRLVQAQRLVRRLDEATKQAYQPDQALIDQLKPILDSLPDNVPAPPPETWQLFKPTVTDDSPFGFKGQIALRELMVPNQELVKFIKQDKVTTAEIEAKAVKEGHMITLLQDGILKALTGQTTIEEVYRVIGN